jgi:hypothetical protein
MSKFVLFGGPFLNIDGPHRGETFGEVLEFSDDDANQLIRGGAAIIPQDDFNRLFSQADVLKYPNALTQQDAPESFKANLLAAYEVFEKLREPVLQDPLPGDSGAVTATQDPSAFGASSVQPPAEL